MTQQDAPQFLICLLQTAEVLSTELSPQKQAGYWLALNDLPLEAFEAGCLAVMRQEAFFPAPVTFRDYAREWLRQQRALTQGHPRAQQVLALREALVPQEEIKALIAHVLKTLPDADTPVATTHAKPLAPVYLVPTADAAQRKAVLRAQLAQLTAEETTHDVA